MAVTRLQLSHFRSHRAALIEGDGRPLAIVGPNGAGKTNILEALSLLSPGKGLRRASTEELARSPEDLGWKIRAVLTAPDRSHEIDTWAEPGNASRTVEIDGKSAPQTALGRIARVLWLVPAMDRLWLEGASERRRFLDRITLSLEPYHADAAVAYEKAMRERNRLLKDNVRDPAWYAGLEAQMARHGAALWANREMALDRLRAAQDGAETAFPRAELSLTLPEDGPEGPDEAELRDALAASRPRDLAAGRSLIGPHRADLTALYAAKGMEARLCSTGEQKALLVSLILANARALAEDFGAAPILLLDEVAAHLDAGRRAALYDEICAMGAQAWMTGTDANLFDALGDRARHLRVTEEGGLSRIEELR
nr:DNA replication/repair protein RecF [Halovulum dunhuangense]